MGDIADYTDQPRPQVVEGAVSAHDLVIEDLRQQFSLSVGVDDAVHFMEDRKAFGLRKYGVVLHQDNGRDFPLDIADEVGDLVAYLRVFMEKQPVVKAMYAGDYLQLLGFLVKIWADMSELREMDER